jgi:hypothetical protein
VSELSLARLSIENERLIDEVRQRNLKYFTDIESFKAIFWRPCRIRILMVTDNGLDFSIGSFGLSTLVSILNSPPPRPYVRIDVTTAHRSAVVSDPEVGVGLPGVVRTIKGFNFANANHFAAGMYDEVWMFGFVTSSAGAAKNSWTNMPTTPELQAICQFMDAGGGLFATGDHGGLGSALCGHVPRVRSMRRWFATAGPFGNPAAPDMNSPQRNDTNRPGHDGGFDFDDQSDDIPQEIDPKFYSRLYGWRILRWPHPVLCGRNGVIRVLPDHPHEGECVLPYETNRAQFGPANGLFNFTEYPNAADGSGQVLPEVIATSRVLAGNNVKMVTVAQTFGAIAAYDGWRANVGRVVTDATWHHFVNINLVGRPAPLVETEPDKQLGFLATPAGIAHFENIKEYYRNIAIWLAPQPIHQCMLRGGLWISIWDHRLLEAVTTGAAVSLARIDLPELLWIGRHARDVLGRFAGQCQILEWIFWILEPFFPIEIIDPIRPWPRIPKPIPDPDPGPWFDPQTLLDLALAGAVVAIREQFPDPDPAVVERAQKELPEIARKGAALALRRGLESLQGAQKRLDALAQAIDKLPRE